MNYDVIGSDHFAKIHSASSLKKASLRSPAGLSSVTNCMKSLNSFRYDNGFDLSEYQRYYAKFDLGESRPEKFESIEQYSAYIDHAVNHEDISLGEYLARDNVGYIEKRISTIVAEGESKSRVWTYVFNDLIEELLLRSIKPGTFDKSDKFILRRVYQEKLLNEAVDKIEGGDGIISKVLDSKPGRITLELAGWIPALTLTGPPISSLKWLKIPYISSKYRRLLRAKDLKVQRRYYRLLSKEQKRELRVFITLNYYKRYYITAVSALYMYWLVEDLFSNESDLISWLLESDEPMTTVDELVSPKCEHVYQCIKEYEEFWIDTGEESSEYLEVKETCMGMKQVRGC